MDNLGHARAACEKVGAVIAQEGVLLAGLGRFFYANTTRDRRTTLEILQAGAAMVEAFAMMRNALRDWDGSNPILRS